MDILTMDIIQNIYHETLQENSRNLKFWEDYLHSLQSLDFGAYSDKLKVPILVPIGSQILFRGELKHTNEVTVSLGADYFTKCSIAQAEVLRLHRIKGAQTKVDLYKQEQEYLHNQFNFSKKNVFQNEGQEIIEHYTVEEDEAWRAKHKENARKYKQNHKEVDTEVDDEELWNRLDELELQEEIENEFYENGEVESEQPAIEYVPKQKEKEIECNEYSMNTRRDTCASKDTKEANNLEILQRVLEKQTELEQKISDLKNRNRNDTKTEADLLSRLDEMEQLDELEDEMDRVEDIIGNGDSESNSDTENLKPPPKVKRSVSFADDEDDEAEVLELTISHSEVAPDDTPYDPDKGLTKPSDIYQAYKHLFNVETTSILKKGSKGQSKKVSFDDKIQENSNKIEIEPDEIEDKTIIIKDVIEKQEQVRSVIEISARPTSLFKKKRQQQRK